jgi:hypothetical protein
LAKRFVSKPQSLAAKAKRNAPVPLVPQFEYFDGATLLSISGKAHGEVESPQIWGLKIIAKSRRNTETIKLVNIT